MNNKNKDIIDLEKNYLVIVLTINIENNKNYMVKVKKKVLEKKKVYLTF